MKYFAPDTIGPYAYFAPDDAPAALVSITSDLACSYAVRGSVAVDLNATYAVRAQVVADLACTYSILAAAGTPALLPVFADLACAYAVRSMVTADLIVEYSIRERVSRDLICTYQIGGDKIIEINARNILRAGKGGGDFRLKSGGRWTIGKDPDDEMFYAVNLVDVLPAGVTVATTPSAPEAIVAGVESLSDVYIQDSMLIVKLGGLALGDDLAPESNTCTFRFYLSNTERCDRTIYFTREDK